MAIVKSFYGDERKRFLLKAIKYAIKMEEEGIFDKKEVDEFIKKVLNRKFSKQKANISLSFKNEEEYKKFKKLLNKYDKKLKMKM